MLARMLPKPPLGQPSICMQCGRRLGRCPNVGDCENAPLRNWLPKLNRHETAREAVRRLSSPPPPELLPPPPTPRRP
jgi:hypothetical protein